MKKIPISDVILCLLPLLIGVQLLLSNICSGWNEGSMNGVCPISFFTPLYNALNGITLILGFTGIIWFPIYLLFFVHSTFKKIIILRQQGFSAIRSNIAGTVIWIIMASPILLLLYYVLSI